MEKLPIRIDRVYLHLKPSRRVGIAAYFAFLALLALLALTGICVTTPRLLCLWTHYKHKQLNERWCVWLLVGSNKIGCLSARVVDSANWNQVGRFRTKPVVVRLDPEV